MAYTHTQYEVGLVATAGVYKRTLGTAANTEVGGRWGPGIHSHLVRGIAMCFEAVTAITSTQTAGVWTFNIGNAGATAATGDTVIDTLTQTTAVATGGVTVLYVKNLDQEVDPGQEVYCQVQTAPTAAILGHNVLFVEPRWELTSNQSSSVMVKSA